MEAPITAIEEEKPVSKPQPIETQATQKVEKVEQKVTTKADDLAEAIKTGEQKNLDKPMGDEDLAAIPEISLNKGLSILDPTVAKMTSADSM